MTLEELNRLRVYAAAQLFTVESDPRSTDREKALAKKYAEMVVKLCNEIDDYRQSYEQAQRNITNLLIQS